MSDATIPRTGGAGIGAAAWWSAGIAGAATMTVELAAVRLLAPWFGTSLPVWTNVLGVVLLGLALGYLIGGRASRGARPLLHASRALLGAALFAALLPWVARPVAALFVPESVALDRAQPLLVWGSLAASLVLYLPTVLCLGALQPLLLEASVRRGAHAGAGGARLFALSTLGSLCGCFGAAHVLIPHAGLELTFHAAGALLGSCGAWLAWHARLEAGAARGAFDRAGLALLLAAGAAQFAPLDRPAPARGMRVLEARDTAYQIARIVEDPSSSFRFLQVNEGFDSFQSAWKPTPGLLGEGYYYDAFALPLAWSKRETGTWRTLLLGAGAATAPRVLEGVRPNGLQLETTLVELDAELTQLAERWMDGGADAHRRWLRGWDARAALRVAGTGYDLVIVDAYANQIEIPPHLCSREFFAAALTVLAPRGWLALNVGGFGFDDPVVAAVGATLAAACGDSEHAVLALRVPASRNVVLVARSCGDAPAPGSAVFRDAPPALTALIGALELPGAWHWMRADRARELSDDRNAIESLQQRSLRDAHGTPDAAP